MKKSIFLFSALCLLLIYSCSTEKVSEDQTSINPNFRVAESTINSNSSSREVVDACYTTNLIAGQNYIAGVVTVELEGDDLIITYTTNEDWTINATHMSIGNCEDQEIPTTGSGNPKVGKFEHSTEHSEGVNQVVYMVAWKVAEDGNHYCFAAHAEVTGPTGGETAWAEGIEFDGKSWAMYVEGN
ncbi:MAG: hypothetical protein DRI75_12265, partial [Bacteroidetes bacterium]